MKKPKLLKMKNEIKPAEGYQDAISKDRFALLMQSFIKESSDDEIVELWKIIVEKSPSRL